MNESNALIDKDLVRVIDILEQVRQLNKMISLHKEESKDEFMVEQYEDMKHRFLTELKEILTEFEIEVSLREDKEAA